MNQSKTKKIIIIDDDQTFREILARSLSRLEYTVENFATPQEALPLIKETSNLTILLDLKLESDSGLRWIKRIKQANSASNLILLTGYASITTAVEAIKLGANDYLTKPITAREIVAHLKKKTEDPKPIINQRPMSVERLEWEHIQKVLLDNQGNISAAARALDMHRRTLQRKLAKKPARE